MGSATAPLEEAKETLNDLEADLTKIQEILKEQDNNNPYSDSVFEENWQERQTLSWIHGATAPTERNELEQGLFERPLGSEMANSPAQKHYSHWVYHIYEKGAYADFSEANLTKPSENGPLYTYIFSLAQKVKEKGWGTKKEKRALNSFLGFLRKSPNEQQAAFIEQVLPKKRDLYHGRILNKISPEAHPLPQDTVASILIELARTGRTGRPDKQLTALESLGLGWLCLTASRLGLPIYLETIKDIKASAIQVGIGFPILLIPTCFGDRPIKISHRLSKFFSALARIPSKKPRDTILQRSRRSLDRMLDETLKNIILNTEYGNITYISLLSPPDPFSGYRIQPKRNRSK